MPGSSTGKEILFHHPFPLTDSPRSGSQLRPLRMLEAFGQLGFDVVEATGFTDDRVPQMRSLRRDIARGRQFAFCYSESVTSPTALSDPSHLPTHPLAEPCFFRALKRAAIPSALFYRDVHWRFDQYRDSVSLSKRVPAEAFYRFDLAWYARFVDIVYLPDLGMARAIPGAPTSGFRALPPGAAIDPAVPEPRTAGSPLRLGYIGSVSPPHNDVRQLLEAVADTPGTVLNISCPEAELHHLSCYPPSLLRNVTTSHLAGDAVDDLYRNSDLLCLVYAPHPYRDFAMPVKLFEAIGHGTPCIADAQAAAGQFVAANGFGWTVRDAADLRARLKSLVKDRREIDAARDRVLRGAEAHTWRARAETVVFDLLGQAPP